MENNTQGRKLTAEDYTSNNIKKRYTLERGRRTHPPTNEYTAWLEKQLREDYGQALRYREWAEKKLEEYAAQSMTEKKYSMPGDEDTIEENAPVFSNDWIDNELAKIPSLRNNGFVLKGAIWAIEKVSSMGRLKDPNHVLEQPEQREPDGWIVDRRFYKSLDELPFYENEKPVWFSPLA